MIVSIYIRELRFREVNLLAQGCAAIRWLSEDSNLVGQVVLIQNSLTLTCMLSFHVIFPEEWKETSIVDEDSE